jgi:hypothetical protein
MKMLRPLAVAMMIGIMPTTPAWAQAKVTDIVVMRTSLAKPVPRPTPTPTPTPSGNTCQALGTSNTPSVSTSMDETGKNTISSVSVGTYSGADWRTRIAQMCTAKSTKAVFCYATTGDSNPDTATWGVTVLTGPAAPKYVSSISRNTYAAAYCN